MIVDTILLGIHYIFELYILKFILSITSLLSIRIGGTKKLYCYF